MPPKETEVVRINCEECTEHDALTGHMTEIKTDLRWIVVLSKWAVGLLGALATILIPCIISFSIYIVGIEHRLVKLETKFNDYCEKEGLTNDNVHSGHGK